MRRIKYAVRFPGLAETDPKSPPDIFSENAVAERERGFFETLHVLDSLAGFVIQKTRTSELGKQLKARKQALDAETDDRIQQLRIQYEEESKRLQIRIEHVRQEMDLELQNLKWETAEKARDFSFSYEEYMKSNELFKRMLIHEKDFFEEAHRYIEAIGEDFSNRREYILYCDRERKSLEMINEYLRMMI